jgi:hypothetical protein
MIIVGLNSGPAMSRLVTMTHIRLQKQKRAPSKNNAKQ